MAKIKKYFVTNTGEPVHNSSPIPVPVLFMVPKYGTCFKAPVNKEDGWVEAGISSSV